MSRSNKIEPKLLSISDIAFNIKGTNKMSCFIGSCIYKITSPTGKIYIGQSKNVEKRISYYSGMQCVEQRKIYASLVKYGWINHKFEVLETCSYSDINEREIYWISFYESFSENNLNILHGGKGSAGRVWTRELRDKLKTANVGKKHSTETIQKIILANTGKKRSQETIDRMKATWKLKRELKELTSPKIIIKKIEIRQKIKKAIKEVVVKERKKRVKIVFSEERKEDIRKRMLINNHFKGKKHSEETKEKMKLAKAKSKLLKINQEV